MSALYNHTAGKNVNDKQAERPKQSETTKLANEITPGFLPMELQDFKPNFHDQF